MPNISVLLSPGHQVFDRRLPGSWSAADLLQPEAIYRGDLPRSPAQRVQVLSLSSRPRSHAATDYSFQPHGSLLMRFDRHRKGKYYGCTRLLGWIRQILPSLEFCAEIENHVNERCTDPSVRALEEVRIVTRRIDNGQKFEFSHGLRFPFNING